MDKDKNESGFSLEQLLGPTGQEMSCRRCFDLIDRYVELELTGLDAAARMPDLRNHLAGCRACNEDHESLLAARNSELT